MSSTIDKSVTDNIILYNHDISKADRITKNGYKSIVIWFTGLSGSGKSTLANGIEKELFKKGYNTYILDGDNVRKGLNNDLDFSESARKENIRRIAEVANLFVDAGIIVLTAFISPFKEERIQARALVGEENFMEVYVDCPIEACKKRDIKGLYAKVRKGKIKNFTGIDSPFEVPDFPDIHIQTHKLSIEEGINKVLEKVLEKIKLR